MPWGELLSVDWQWVYLLAKGKRTNWRLWNLLSIIFFSLPLFVAIGIRIYLSRQQYLEDLTGKTDWSDISGLYGSIVYCLLASYAFLSPAMGSRVRKDLARSRLFRDSLTTSLTGRDYLVSSFALLLRASLMFSFLFLSIATGVCLFFSCGFSLVQSGLTGSLLGDFLDAFHHNLKFGRNEYIWFQCIPGVVLMSFVYGAGFLYRSARLFQHTQGTFKRNMQGGLLTAVLIVSMALSIIFRFFIISIINEEFNIEGWEWLMFNATIFLVEGPVLVFRLNCIERIWREMQDTFMLEVRRIVLEDNDA